MQICKCGCGSTKIENKELGLCATSNKARRKAQIPAKVKAKAKINRTPIKKVSTAKAAKNALKQKAYNKLRHIDWCETCGSKTKPLSNSHIVSVKQNESLEDNVENIIKECFGDSTCCHDIWENGDMSQLMLQRTFARKVRVMHKLDPEYLGRFIANRTHPENFNLIRNLIYKLIEIENE